MMDSWVLNKDMTLPCIWVNTNSHNNSLLWILGRPACNGASSGRYTPRTKVIHGPSLWPITHHHNPHCTITTTVTLSLGSNGCWNYSNSCTVSDSVWSVMKSIWRYVKFWQIIISSACYPNIDNSRKLVTFDNFCRWRTSCPGRATIPCLRSSSWKTLFGASLTRRTKSNSGSNPVLLKWTWPEKELYVRANKCTDSSLLFKILARWFHL